MTSKKIKAEEIAFNSWLNYSKWRWEFMRRDPEYQKDWQTVKEIRLKAGQPLKADDVVLAKYKHCKGFYTEYHLCGKYGIQFPLMIDPETTFDDLLKQSWRKGFYGEEGFDWFRNTDKIIGKIVAPAQGVDFSFDIQKNPNKLMIEIDFLKINSIPQLQAEISRKIQKYASRITRKPQVYGGKDFDFIITVGEMKQGGLSASEIARKIRPRDFDNNNDKGKPESAIRLVYETLKEYDRLIKGGWKDISFP